MIDGAREADQALCQPFALSHQPQTIPALRKHCLSLPEVILMGTDVFMIINKISKGEFYGHMETLKSRSLL